MMETSARARLAPQMAIYDRMRMTWLPHVMYLQEPDFHSPVCNTDAHGFRLSTGPRGGAIGFAEAAGQACNLLVGNSTAFGVAATSDATTLSSALAHETGEAWLNFTGRSFSSTQELILFQIYFAELARAKRIVIFSGANNLILHHRSARYPQHYGSFFFWRQFERAMLDAALTPNRRRLKSILAPFYGERIDYESVPLKSLPAALLGLVRTKGETRPGWPGGRGERSADDVTAWIRRDLTLWRMIADRTGAELLYVLQPLGGWVQKRRSAEENALFDEVRRSTRRFNRVLAHDFDAAMHARYAGELARGCRENNIEFLDMNEALAAAAIDGRWIFNDFIHLTDEGYALAGTIIARRLARAEPLRTHA